MNMESIDYISEETQLCGSENFLKSKIEKIYARIIYCRQFSDNLLEKKFNVKEEKIFKENEFTVTKRFYFLEKPNLLDISSFKNIILKYKSENIYYENHYWNNLDYKNLEIICRIDAEEKFIISICGE